MSDEPLLHVDEIAVHYGGVVALESVSFTVETGEIVGLIGPNGAGKTSCLDTLTGFTPAHRGHVSFRGRRIDDMSAAARARAGLVRTFQSLELFDDLTVRENLWVAASTPSWRETLTDALWPKRHDPSGVEEILTLVGLAADAERRPTELSNGARHLAALGRALVARPHLLLLDEPAAGLDPDETEELRSLLGSLPERGVSVLLVDHDMPLVLGVCDRVHVLDYGRIIASGPPAAIRSDPEVIEAYLGTTHGTREEEA